MSRMRNSPSMARHLRISGRVKGAAMQIKKSVYLFVLFIMVGSAATLRAQNGQVLNEAQRVTGDRFTVSVRTSRGANVYAVSRPPAAMLNGIDSGLTDLFAVARKNGYRRKLNYADYTIYIGK